MKIIYNKEGYVDFENPIYMEEDQLDKLKKFLTSLLNQKIEIREVNEKERFMNADTEKHPKRWGENELILLLDTKISESELIKKLKRSQMSIAMQKAQFIPEFVSWAKSKGFEANKITRTIIKQFLEEKDDTS